MTTYVGTNVKRFEDPSLITGAGTFVSDIQLPGMLHASVLRSPHAHARIKSIDVANARKLPGVVAVVSGEDLEGTEEYLPIGNAPPNTYMTPVAHPVLARGMVRYVGEPIAVAVAEDPYLARDALDLIEIGYEPLPAVVDPDDAMKDKVILHEALGTNVVFSMEARYGDLEEAFREAHRVVKGRYETQRVSPAPMETRGMVASYERDTDFLMVWSSTNSPHGQREVLAQVLKRKQDTIRVVSPDVGGAFGLKGAIHPDMAVVCYLAIKLGRPIKWIEDRSESLVTYQGRGITSEMEAAVNSEGTILGFRCRAIGDFGAYFFSSSQVPLYNMVRRIMGPYKTTVAHIEARGVATNKPPTGPYRGTGGPEATYLMERTMDLIAYELGLDPAEVRRNNVVPPDALPYPTPTGLIYDSGDYAQALDAALKLADYEGLRREQAQARKEGRLTGIGVVSYIKGCGGSGHLRISNASVEINSEGQVNIPIEMTPHGQGSETTMAQIAADVLGLKPEDVKLHHSDTTLFDSGMGHDSSRTVVTGGSAMYIALQEARKKLSQIAADFFQCPPEDVEFRERKIFPKSRPDRAASFAEIAARAFDEETLPPGLEPGLEFFSRFELPQETFPFGAWVVVVEVDRDTGEVRLLRCIGVHDCGRMINPKLVEGQIHGCLGQGLGQAMSEEMVYTPEGQPATGTFMDYGMLLAEDMPHLIIETPETVSSTNPLEAKGTGSASIVGVPAAVSGAVADALAPLGVHHLDTPFTPEKVWQALHQARA